MNILFASSEAYPLIKTGGLADVAGALPLALDELGDQPRLILPAYPAVLEQADQLDVVAQTRHYEQDIRLLQTRLPGSEVPVYLVDCPAAFARDGNPYLGPDGQDWPDNAWRFALFNQVVVDVALNRIGLDWPVDVVHCNDWQTGLTPPLLSLFEQRPATLFTIHNLAYQGIFPAQTFFDLGFPDVLWGMNGVEFHGLFSFIKGGLVYADRVNAVSPNYAQEITSAEFGYGLEGLLLHRGEQLNGILNGIDTQVWNPTTDAALAQNYEADNLAPREANKRALQQRFNLQQESHYLMLGMITRLVNQKGLDLVLEAMPRILELPIQLVLLGSGDAYYENAFNALAQHNPGRIGVQIGYNESLSHQIEGGCDLYLMPSLFEPCGLNQMYSLRYGALPLVTQVGGLKDSVVDAYLPAGNGFVMPHSSVAGLLETLERALGEWQRGERWRMLQRNAMAVDHSWRQRAREYQALYQYALDDIAG